MKKFFKELYESLLGLAICMLDTIKSQKTLIGKLKYSVFYPFIYLPIAFFITLMVIFEFSMSWPITIWIESLKKSPRFLYNYQVMLHNDYTGQVEYLFESDYSYDPVEIIKNALSTCTDYPIDSISSVSSNRQVLFARAILIGSDISKRVNYVSIDDMEHDIQNIAAFKSHCKTFTLKLFTNDLNSRNMSCHIKISKQVY